MKKLAILLVLALLPALAVAEVDKPYAGTTITVFNWADYIDPDVLDIFTEETGIEVKYVNFDTNETMYSKLESGAGAYDVIFPSDYIIERMIKEDSLHALNFDNIPNAKNVMDWLEAPAYDPEGAYSVPYMWGTVGILYDTQKVKEPITSWKTMFSDEYQNDVFMLNSYRDSLGIALKMLGYSLNTRNMDELEAAKDALIEQKAAGIVAGYLVDEPKDKMVAGEAAMALMWSGDALYAMDKNEDLAYVVPVEGSNVWVDGMCIPADSANKEAAECFINFMCREDIAQLNMDYIFYSTPIQAVVDNMDEELKNNETINPPQDVIDRCEFFHDVSEDIDMYEEIWMEVRLAR